MSTWTRCDECGADYNMVVTHTCDREALYARALQQIDALRAALAAAEAKLADERKHADMLHRAMHAYALNDAVTGTQPPASAIAAMEAHAARRKEEAR